MYTINKNHFLYFQSHPFLFLLFTSHLVFKQVLLTFLISACSSSSVCLLIIFFFVFFFFPNLSFFMFLLNHVFHIVLTFLSLTVPLDYFSQTQIFHFFFLLCFKQRWTAACVVVHKVANHKYIWVQNAKSELIISKKRSMMINFFFFGGRRGWG